MPIALGYFFQSFENGIGNISTPTINFLSGKKEKTSLDTIIIWMIYISWFMA